MPHLEKEDIFIAEKEELGIYLKRESIFFAEEEKKEKEKEENIWRKKYFGSSQLGAVLSGTLWNWVSVGRNWLIHEGTGSVKEWYWLALGDTGSVEGVTGWYLVVLGQYRSVLVVI